MGRIQFGIYESSQGTNHAISYRQLYFGFHPTYNWNPFKGPEQGHDINPFLSNYYSIARHLDCPK